MGIAFFGPAGDDGQPFLRGGPDVLGVGQPDLDRLVLLRQDLDFGDDVALRLLAGGQDDLVAALESLKNLILDGSPTSFLRHQAQQDGMRSLRESGLLAIYDGVTTVEEVLRETL